MKKLLFIAVLSTGFCYSCNNDIPNIPVPPDQWIELDSRTQQEMGATGNMFATNLMLQMNQQIPDQNMMISPMSLQFALGMLNNGTDEEAFQEIINIMGLNDYSLQMMNSYYYNLNQLIKKKEKNFTINLANAIWIQKNYPVEQTFIENNKDFFDAKITNIDFFQKEKAQKNINQWVNDATKGTIKKLSFTINDMTRIVLANACYLKGKWAVPFKKDKTKKAIFHNQNGNTSVVDMMHLTEMFNFFNEENAPFIAVELPYCNETFNMLVILPKEGKTLKEVLPEIQWSNLQLTNQKVKVELPKFKIEANYPEQIKNSIKEMGITRIFKIGSLPGINEELFINQITQDVFINVDESGTEAAAVTIFGGDVSAGPPNPIPLIRMDRPFAFAIRENTTGSILFMGKVVKM